MPFFTKLDLLASIQTKVRQNENTRFYHLSKDEFDLIEKVQLVMEPKISKSKQKGQKYKVTYNFIISNSQSGLAIRNNLEQQLPL